MSFSKSFHERSRQNRMILAAVAVIIIIAIIAAGIGWAMRPPQPPPLPEDAAKTQPADAGQGSNQSSVDIKGEAMSHSKPLSIRIPAMDLPETKLVHLGQNPDGTIKVPLGANTNEPAWYKLGPAPGQIGPAILMGHAVDENNEPSIFFKLSSLRAGDKVYIPREDGQTAIFTITKVQTFAKSQFPTELVYGSTDHSALRLVTCGGLGEGTQLGEYTQNVIAFAELTGSEPTQ